MAFIKIGAGWKVKSGKGYRCTVEEDIPEGGSFFIFKNEHKKLDKHPDITLGRFEDDENSAPAEEPVQEKDIPF